MTLDKKELQQAEWTRQYNLTEEQVKELICNKLRRANENLLSLKQRDSKFFA